MCSWNLLLWNDVRNELISRLVRDNTRYTVNHSELFRVVPYRWSLCNKVTFIHSSSLVGLFFLIYIHIRLKLICQFHSGIYV
jgi:hypothetical protein